MSNSELYRQPDALINNQDQDSMTNLELEKIFAEYSTVATKRKEPRMRDTDLKSFLSTEQKIELG